MATNAALAEMQKYLKANHGCVLSTIVDGAPRATPVNYFSNGKDIYIFSEGGRKFTYLLKNNRVSVSIYHVRPLFGVQVLGTAQIIKQEDPAFMKEVKRSGFMEGRQFPGGRPPYFLSLVKVTPEKIIYWATKEGRPGKTIWDAKAPKGTCDVIYDKLEFHDNLGVKHVYPDRPKHATPIVFVPDAFQGSWAYTEFQDYFAPKGWETYAMNFRGHFVSRYARLEGSPPGGITGRETIDDYIEDLAKTVSLCKRPPHIVATGLGALVALKYAERNGVGKMLLINPTPTRELFESLGLDGKKVRDNLKGYVTFARNGTCMLKRETAKKWLFSGRRPEIHTEFESMSFLNEEPSRLFERAFTGGISVTLGRRKGKLFILGTKKNLLANQNVNSALSKLLGADKLRLVDKGCQALPLARDWERYAKLIDSWLR